MDLLNERFDFLSAVFGKFLHWVAHFFSFDFEFYRVAGRAEHRGFDDFAVGVDPSLQGGERT